MRTCCRRRGRPPITRPSGKRPSSFAKRSSPAALRSCGWPLTERCKWDSTETTERWLRAWPPTAERWSWRGSAWRSWRPGRPTRPPPRGVQAGTAPRRRAELRWASCTRRRARPAGWSPHRPGRPGARGEEDERCTPRPSSRRCTRSSSAPCSRSSALPGARRGAAPRGWPRAWRRSWASSSAPASLVAAPAEGCGAAARRLPRRAASRRSRQSLQPARRRSWGSLCEPSRRTPPP
mmetsp:Transcript_36670/g.105681  ORF Transcript_36670/g.105681 Transcript_36670/m.105681 type:complete len:236 (+) Transcript_36670:313-1020(+)